MVDIVVFGGDGYIGWPLALSLAATYGDKSVLIVDNFLTRRNSAKVGGSSLVPISSMDERIKAYEETFGNNNLSFRELDNSDPDAVTELFREISPEAVFHLAHQRAAPYSMLGLKETVETIVNNEVGFLNLIWVAQAPLPRLSSDQARELRGLCADRARCARRRRAHGHRWQDVVRACALPALER